ILAFANIFVYIARYAMVDWGPTYLKEVKGASLTEGGFSTLVIEFAGAAGMLTMGWLSDKLGGRRARVSVLAMVPLTLAFGALILTGSLLLVERDLKDAPALVTKLQNGTDPLSTFLWEAIPEKSRVKLSSPGFNPGAQRAVLKEELNTILKSTNSWYSSERFAQVNLREETKALIASPPKKSELVYLHRVL